MTAAELYPVEIPAPFAETYAGPGTPKTREHDWPRIAASAPTMAATMLRYLDQIALSLRPASVTAANGILRGFGGWIAAHHPEVVDGAADLAEVIGLHCPSVRVIATSREGLGMNAEQLVAIGPLDVTGAAVELFEQRATSLDRSFDLDEWRESVEDICRRLDGVPLAIELAAARMRSLTPADMLARLDESFGLLSGGRRRSIERHRTLRATIHWSYDSLDASEQLLFCRLRSLLARSISLRPSESRQATISTGRVGRVLGDLVERSIVVSEAGAHGRRFRLLEMMRQFGAEELAAAGNTHLIADRHARFVADEIVEIQQLLGGRDEVVGAARLEELWPNVRVAFEWATARRDLRSQPNSSARSRLSRSFGARWGSCRNGPSRSLRWPTRTSPSSSLGACCGARCDAS